MELWELTVTETAAAIRDGRISAVERLEAALDRITTTDLNAVVTLSPGSHKEAEAVDQLVGSGRPPAPLLGVPFTVKDTLDVAGLRTTAGSRLLGDHIAVRSATAVQRLRRAGAIVVGKTNCSEFAVDTHTDNPLFGATPNPVAPGRTVGGSSGGDAAAVAAGLVPFGLGTDFGGSIRWPAHCTGTSSLRPTPGVLPSDGIMPFAALAGASDDTLLLRRLMTVGPIARTAQDVWLIFQVLAGRTPTPVPAIGGLAHGLAWCAGEGTVPVSRAVTDLVAAAAEQLGALVGGAVELAPPRLDECAALFAEIRDGQGLPEVQQLAEGRHDLLGTRIAAYLGSLSLRSADDLAPAERRLAEIRAGVLGFLEVHEVLLLPVASVAAPVHAAVVDVDGTSVPWSQIGSCCRAISVLGLPSAVVPCGRDADGVPIGIQVVGRPRHEQQVLAVAAAVERLPMSERVGS